MHAKAAGEGCPVAILYCASATPVRRIGRENDGRGPGGIDRPKRRPASGVASRFRSVVGTRADASRHGQPVCYMHGCVPWLDLALGSGWLASIDILVEARGICVHALQELDALPSRAVPSADS